MILIVVLILFLILPLPVQAATPTPTLTQDSLQTIHERALKNYNNFLLPSEVTRDTTKETPGLFIGIPEALQTLLNQLFPTVFGFIPDKTEVYSNRGLAQQQTELPAELKAKSINPTPQVAIVEETRDNLDSYYNQSQLPSELEESYLKSEGKTTLTTCEAESFYEDSLYPTEYGVRPVTGSDKRCAPK